MRTEPQGAADLHPTRDPDVCASAQRAIDESFLLLDQCWSAWCSEHDVSPVPRPLTRPPVVSQVGLDRDALEWVALVRFDVRVDHQQLHGLVRGPVGDAIFTVHPTVGVAAPARRHWPLSRNRRI